MGWRRWTVRGGFVIVAGGILGSLLTPHFIGAQGACRPALRSCAPAFRLQDTGGNWIRLDQYRGRPVMLNFWAVSCPACWQEEPALKKAARHYQPRGLVMLGIDAWAEPLPFVRRYLHYDPFPYRVLVDPSQGIPDVYGMWKTPQTVFIDRRGTITGIYPGPIAYGTLAHDIQEIIGLRRPNARSA